MFEFALYRRRVRSISMVLYWTVGFCFFEAKAVETEVGGHAKYQFSHTEQESDDLISAFGPETFSDHQLDLRLNSKFLVDDFDFVAQAGSSWCWR